MLDQHTPERVMRRALYTLVDFIKKQHFEFFFLSMRADESGDDVKPLWPV